MSTGRTGRFELPRCLATGAAIAMLSTPSLAADACPQWALQGELVFVHSNGTVVKLSRLEQAGSRFNGAGHFYRTNQASAGGPFGSSIIKHRDVDGHVVGTAVGNLFEATVYWGSTSIGVYTGQIGPQGLLVGRTYDKTDPTEAAGYQSDKPLVCLNRVLGALVPGAVPARPASAPGTVQSEAPQPLKAPSAMSSPASSQAQGSTMGAGVKAKGALPAPRASAAHRAHGSAVAGAASAAKASPLASPARTPKAAAELPSENQLDAVRVQHSVADRERVGPLSKRIVEAQGRAASSAIGYLK